MGVKKGLFLAIGVLSVLLSACSSAPKHRQWHAQLKEHLNQKDYKAAETLVKDPEFYKDDNSALLRWLERGTVFYLNGDYYQAAQAFEKAHSLSDELYTQRMGRRLEAAVLGASKDNYYGTRYEVSLLRFYESLTHFNLYQTGIYEAYEETDEEGNVIQVEARVLSDNERLDHLYRARSILMEWDTLLNSYAADLAGKATYKSDLVQKLYGAFIHEKFGGEDQQIALQLYKDAQDILLKNFNEYPSFNAKSNEFNKHFDKLAEMSLEEVELNYVQATPNATDLLDFVNQKIEQLSNQTPDNVSLLLKDGFVAEKKVRRVVIGLLPGFEPAEGDIFLTDLASVAALLTNSMGGDLNEFISWVLVGGVVSFEIPYIEKPVAPMPYTAHLMDETGTERAAFPIVLLDPVNEMAAQEFAANNMALITKTATKFALEHAAAIVAAYQLWKAAPKDNFLMEKAAKIGAILSYRAAAKLINSVNQADLRYWSSLAGNIRMGRAQLPDGDYNLVITSDADNLPVYQTPISVHGEAFVDVNL